MQVSANTQALRARIIGLDFSSYLTSWNLKTTSGQHLSLGRWWGINTMSPRRVLMIGPTLWSQLTPPDATRAISGPVPNH